LSAPAGIAGKDAGVEPEKSGVDGGDRAMPAGDGTRRFGPDHRVHPELYVEADLCKIEPKQVDLYRIGADLVLDRAVFDPRMDICEILPENCRIKKTQKRQ
jgi:hypothetical protein